VIIKFTYLAHNEATNGSVNLPKNPASIRRAASTVSLNETLSKNETLLVIGLNEVVKKRRFLVKTGQK
jgi:hypothetical protein